LHGESEESMRNQELVDKARNGHPGAFDELYFSYVDRVQRQLYGIVGAGADVDDLIQQTFVQVYRNLDGFRGDSSFATWLHRITVNVALGHLRKKKRWFKLREAVSNEPADAYQSEATPLRSVECSETRELLASVLDKLKPKKRIVFVLYEIEGHTLEEIATIVESSVNTVAGRLRAARLEIRRALEHHQRMDTSMLNRHIA
jgi:RNA polymerase sigma-70 factor, ECF subfamily